MTTMLSAACLLLPLDTALAGSAFWSKCEGGHAAASGRQLSWLAPIAASQPPPGPCWGAAAADDPATPSVSSRGGYVVGFASCADVCSDWMTSSLFQYTDRPLHLDDPLGRKKGRVSQEQAAVEMDLAPNT